MDALEERLPLLADDNAFMEDNTDYVLLWAAANLTLHGGMDGADGCAPSAAHRPPASRIGTQHASARRLAYAGGVCRWCRGVGHEGPCTARGAEPSMRGCVGSSPAQLHCLGARSQSRALPRGGRGGGCACWCSRALPRVVGVVDHSQRTRPGRYLHQHSGSAYEAASHTLHSGSHASHPLRLQRVRNERLWRATQSPQMQPLQPP